MKKMSALFLIILLTLTCLTACTREYEPADSTTQPTMIGDYVFSHESEEEKTIDFDQFSLVDAYCNNKWDGSFIKDEHCASIINGELWIDCLPAEMIPNMGIYEDSFWLSVVSSNDDGTWVHDRKLGTIELWKKGTRYEKIYTNFRDSFLTSVYVLDNCIICWNKTEINVFSFDGYNITNISKVIDCYQTDNNTVKYSTFSHENFEINGNGKETKLDTNYVRFPRENVQLRNDMTNSLTLPFNNYWSENWESCTLYISNNNFYYINFYGYIYINNELVGNINLGVGNKVEKTGSNLLSNDNRSLYLDGEKLVIYEKGESTNVDIPDGEGVILWSDTRYGTILMIYGTTPNNNTLLIVRNEEVDIISDKVSDAFVPYNTIYYMEDDNVYSLEWQNPEAESELFFEGAYAVSHRSDELEGAIVPDDKNNMKEYGEYNLYSPYGDDEK